MNSFTLPKINLNGTSAKSLFNEYNETLAAVRAAEQFFRECTCHGRDFQCNDSGDYVQAQFERADVLAKLDDIKDYLTSWRDHANEALES
jgi:hypothetical protein